MSHSHTTPAPPPPLLAAHHGMLQKHHAPAKNLIDECLWAVDHPEVQKACFLARVCAVQPPKRCQFRDIAGILQVGPTCGLTALSMLLGGAPAPDQLLTTARELHYTNNGEMFSARNLFQLICDNLMPTKLANNNNNNINNNNTIDKNNDNDEERNSRNSLECAMHEGPLNCAKVRDSLVAGDCLFVPYPFDNNFSLV